MAKMNGMWWSKHSNWNCDLSKIRLSSISAKITNKDNGIKGARYLRLNSGIRKASKGEDMWNGPADH